MKQSKEDVISALELIATKSLNIKEKAFYHMFNHSGIVGAVKDIVYLMFVNKKETYTETDDMIYEAMLLVREYCGELDKYGEVHFDIKYGGEEYNKLYTK